MEIPTCSQRPNDSLTGEYATPLLTPNPPGRHSFNREGTGWCACIYWERGEPGRPLLTASAMKPTYLPPARGERQQHWGQRAWGFSGREDGGAPSPHTHTHTGRLMLSHTHCIHTIQLTA